MNLSAQFQAIMDAQSTFEMNNGPHGSQGDNEANQDDIQVMSEPRDGRNDQGTMTPMGQAEPLPLMALERHGPPPYQSGPNSCLLLNNSSALMSLSSNSSPAYYDFPSRGAVNNFCPPPGAPPNRRFYQDTATRAERVEFSVATPFHVTGDHMQIAEVIGQETEAGFELGPLFTHGSMLFNGDQLQPMHIPSGHEMLETDEWDQRHFSTDEAACIAIGDTRARFPVLFNLMQSAGAPAAQIAREILRREQQGFAYHVSIYQLDPVTGRYRNFPPPSSPRLN